MALAEDDDVAIIGIGCNFPGGSGLENFWKVLSEGRNCVTDIPEERFDSAYWYDPDESKPGKTQTTKAALIDGFNEFDHRFFGVSEAEADVMDPQQKLLLQCTYRALEDAGVAMEVISGTRTGVYIGVMNRDYDSVLSNSPSRINHYHGTGTAVSVAANRISFTFNLTGPSFAIDSACSSSLVALHSACQAIKQRDCEMALCGGVSCIMEPRVFVALSKAKMISPDGTSRPFCSTADGYGRGEGCGVVLLKPLKHALRDRNKIWGVVSKTAVNQDGRSVSPITKPSMVQQEELLRRVYSESDLRNVQYIEAHGTGTPIGDPTEAGSISNVIAKARPPGSETLRIGSVKSNIGHTESAAGVAGLIKVLLMMKHETIVPTVFYSEHSSSIDAKALGMRIPTTCEKWETNGSVEKLAGINSFGFGGTNAHTVVKEYRQTTIREETVARGCPKVFVMSAASEKSLSLSIADTRQRLSGDNNTNVQAIAYTSACARTHRKHKYRKAFLTSSISDLERQLRASPNKKAEPIRPDVRLALVFCGNGVTYSGMCKQLLQDAPVFREKVREVEDLFRSYNKSISIVQRIADGYDNNSDHTKPDIVQPLIFAMQVGISGLLKHWGVKPDAALGHSVGEVAAAHCAGLLSLADAVKVIHHRSVLQSQVTGGKMLVVGNVAVAKVLQTLPGFSGKVCVAALNSPRSCTLSGDADAIDMLRCKLSTEFTDEKPFLHVLDVPAAYHSHMMDPIVCEISERIGPLPVDDPMCELYSTVTGAQYSTGDFSTGGYWARNIRETVLFEKTIRAAAGDEQTRRNTVFVEIGPRRALRRNILETLGNSTVVLASAQPENDRDAMLSTVAKLFELGVQVDWHRVYSGCETLPSAFPIYQFDNQRKSLNFKAEAKGNKQSVSTCHPLMIPQTKRDHKEHKCVLSLETAPYLWDHKNNGVSIAPGALYVELAYAALMSSLTPKVPVSSLQLSVTFQSLFTLSSNFHQMKVILEHAENETAFKVQSSTATHAFGTCRYTNSQPSAEEHAISLDVIVQRCASVIDEKEVYAILSQGGFEYGPVFRQLGNVHFGHEFQEAVTAVKVPGEILCQLHEYYLHPVVLDYFLQMTAVVASNRLTGRPGFPSAIGCIAVTGALQPEMVLYMRATQETADFLDVCGCFASKDGRVLVELRQVRITFLGRCSNVSESPFFHSENVALDHTASDVTSQIKAIVFKDDFGIAKALRPHIHPESAVVANRERWLQGELQALLNETLRVNPDLEDVLFIWGVRDLGHLSSEQTLEALATCCELFRQVVLALKRHKRSCTLRVITYRSSEKLVDHVSPGFVLSGMTRACAAEVEGLSFQSIDLASVTSEDIQTLVSVINGCKHHQVSISKGQAWSTTIARTPLNNSTSEGSSPAVYMKDFLLQTANPYTVLDVSATPCAARGDLVQGESVEIRLTNICVHSSDYFPVSVSHLRFGKTFYWNEHSSHNHTLLALDFNGVVTAVGEDVRKLKVGDNVVCCYPVAAASRITVPEAACYDTNSLPILKEISCMSYFVLAWEILQRTLPRLKQHRRLAIISSSPASGLLKVIALTASRSGWNVISRQCFQKELLNVERCSTFVFLPPIHQSWQVIREHGGPERHVIFVCDDPISTLVAENIFENESEHIHLDRIDVAAVFRRASLKAQSAKISRWVKSLSLDTMSLPLKRHLFKSQLTEESKSYFTATTLKQVVLDHEGSDSNRSHIPVLTRPGQLFKQRCVYIVTGGLSGLGLETVKFIAHHGDCITTLSRSAPSVQTQTEMDTLHRRCGVAILNLQCDVSVSGQVVEAINKIRQRFPSCPIKGVFHSAAVLQDALIDALDQSLFQTVLRPKVSGALNLHFATLHNKLDFFVCYSSISSVVGNVSQCNYVAANSFLDAFCRYRRNLGLAGQAINWGPLNLGLLLNKGHFQRFLERRGMVTMDVGEVHEMLERCLRTDNPQQVVCKFNIRNLHKHVLSQNAALRERLSALVEVELREDAATRPRLQRQEELSVRDSVRKMVSDVSNVDEMGDDDTALYALGIDSMLAMTLQNQIFEEMGVNVPLVRIMDPGSTLNTLVGMIEEGRDGR